ncbi:MAG: hypothetical protein PUK59_02695 [Actinomycetaceae bacterium]|nr:hypothetical protein [Actinomycetaceae bacterium]MDY5273984.1 hypothetical protein [Arcanobacterium sp.]
MNIHEANQIIRLLNQMAEAVTSMGAIVEQTAWNTIEDHAGMPGERPITAARLENPYADEDILEAEIVEEEPDDTASEPEPEAERSPQKLLDMEDVRFNLAELSRRGLTDFIKAQIHSFGHTKLSQLSLEQANAVLAAAEAEAEGGGA